MKFASEFLKGLSLFKVPRFGDAAGTSLVKYGGGTVNLVSGPSNGSFTVAPSGNRLSKWAAAKNRIGSANRRKHLVLGDSNVVGQGSGSGDFGLIDAFHEGFVTRFAALSGQENTGYFGDQNVSVVNIYSPTYYRGLSLGPSWSPDIGPTTIGGKFLISPPNSNSELQIIATQEYDSFDMWYPVAPYGLCQAVEVKVDGAFAVSLNEYIAEGAFFEKVHIENLSLGTHTITIKGDYSGNAYMPGFIFYDSSNKKPAIIQGGWCGASAANLSNTDTPWSPLSEAYILAPDLVTFYCTINDSNGGTDTAAYYSQVEKIVSALSPIADGCLIVGYPSDSENTTNGKLDALANALAQMASDRGWAVYDSRDVFGHSNATASARGMVFDGSHPNPAGHQALANGYFEFLKKFGL